MTKNAAAVELGRRRQSSQTKAERSAHGRMMALARWGSSLKESLTRAREIPEVWLRGYIQREMLETGCSQNIALERAIEEWEGKEGEAPEILREK